MTPPPAVWPTSIVLVYLQTAGREQGIDKAGFNDGLRPTKRHDHGEHKSTLNVLGKEEAKQKGCKLEEHEEEYQKDTIDDLSTFLVSSGYGPFEVTPVVIGWALVKDPKAYHKRTGRVWTGGEYSANYVAAAKDVRKRVCLNCKDWYAEVDQLLKISDKKGIPNPTPFLPKEPLPYDAAEQVDAFRRNHGISDGLFRLPAPLVPYEVLNGTAVQFGAWIALLPGPILL